ncbi:MAG: glycosyltransferase [Oscillospiraceae bacterium]|nr:glycosyltransferase [Oscillospiraceae bacterium]
MKYDFSVIVLSYHPNKEKLFATLRSVLLQKDCRFEVIVADDGSGEFYEPEIRAFFAEQSFEDYRIIGHEHNQGTVLNLLDAADAAQGGYIKPISPGDYLYDELTLRDLKEFMDDQGVKAVFGDMVYYSADPEFRVFNTRTPWDDSIYSCDAEQFDCRRSMKHQMVYLDNISGASVAYTKDAFCSGLRAIAGHVRYAEDAVLQLMVLQGDRICKIPRFVVWYEYGTGISTDLQAGPSPRLKQDFYRFYAMLHEQYPNAPYVGRTYHRWKLMMEGNKLENLLRRFTQIDKLQFVLKKQVMMKNYTCSDYDDRFFRQVCER